MAKIFLVSLLFSFCVIFIILCDGTSVAASLSRDDFPPGFVFGASTSAYQIEGAAAEGGRKPSILDKFYRAGNLPDNSNGDVAADQYHKYKEDAKLMYETGLDAYRFSIAWPRLIPDGRGDLNPIGLQYYNNLINELLSYGIEPHVTLYHFDLPLALQEAYNGILSNQFIDDFTAYADVCFREFGDRVKSWVTLNEPNLEPLGGYDKGVFPPQRCSYPFGVVNCTGGNSSTEPYIVGHHLLLAHSSAVSLYREKYQAEQGGKIGVTLMAYWHEPATRKSEDVAAAKRAMDFHIGWILHPIVNGTYPAIMRQIAGSRLPQLTEEDSAKVKGSFDFLGINHYLTIPVQSDMRQLESEVRDYMSDVAVKFIESADGLKVTPWGFSKLLEHIKMNYGNPPIMIHENGYAETVDNPTSRTYNDDFRINFLEQYLQALHLAIRNGSNTKGYFVWSFIDCFDLFNGYTYPYGLYGVDFESKEKIRYTRSSARWYANLLGSKIQRQSASCNGHMNE